jgi:hypothetical protein
LPDRTIVAGWPTEFTRYYRSWTASRSVYIIANVKPALPGIKLSPPIAIDAGHSAWRVQ